ncbi:MAG: nucleotidyl transferase AbiEii/AbiGii toxin family protein [Candidatus Omnitrophica bacterium]|nr:nucleotidyl transferase AbiEii/AbiGii toxin family protein [Candidatus Omnitrophota bacterium]
MPSRISQYQEKVLRLLSDKLEEFYLAGGTALSLYYFHHRESLDLDFFTHDFERVKIKRIIDELSKSLGKKIELISEQNRKNILKIAVYLIHFSKKDSLKIDFVEDMHRLIKSPKIINGIAVLSLEDIYLRKIYAMTGTFEAVDVIGAKMVIGGRQEAKDFYDLYCLSTVFMSLSQFAEKFCDAVRKEALIRWFRTYDRMEVKTSLLDLRTNKKIDYNTIEKHFKKQIDRLIEEEIGF